MSMFFLLLFINHIISNLTNHCLGVPSDDEMSTTSSRIHRKTAGTAVCIHTCVRGGCQNRHGSILWPKEGSPLRRHAINANRHPACTVTCPGYQILGHSSGKFIFQKPAPAEQQLDQDNVAPNDNMDVDTELSIASTSHTTQSPSIISIASHSFSHHSSIQETQVSLTYYYAAMLLTAMEGFKHWKQSSSASKILSYPFCS